MSMGTDLDSMMPRRAVVFVDQDGYVIENLQGVTAPEVFVKFVEFGDSGRFFYWAEADAAERAWDDGWRLLVGWSKKPRQSDSFIMHHSESVTGDLARHIMSRPGYYCTVAVRDGSAPRGEVIGWCVAYRKTIV